jgi:hypothetical protein
MGRRQTNDVETHRYQASKARVAKYGTATMVGRNPRPRDPRSNSDAAREIAYRYRRVGPLLFFWIDFFRGGCLVLWILIGGGWGDLRARIDVAPAMKSRSEGLIFRRARHDRVFVTILAMSMENLAAAANTSWLLDR